MGRRRSSAWLPAGAAVTAIGVAMMLAAGAGAAYHAANTVDTAIITVAGASARALTDAGGKTLYYLATDTPARSTCTGTCAAIWPPLLSDSPPAAEEPLPGKLSLVKTANGSQVAYNGHLLYTYSGDTAPRQTNGNGVGGKWWVAKLDVKPAMMGMPAATPAAPATNKEDQGHGGY